MPSSVSSSKGSIRTLLLEGVNDSAVELFVSSNFSNIERLPKALDADGLLQAIKGVDLLGIRSRTQLTHEALAGADRLVAVGCFSVGTNQVDLDAARRVPFFLPFLSGVRGDRVVFKFQPAWPALIAASDALFGSSLPLRMLCSAAGYALS